MRLQPTLKLYQYRLDRLHLGEPLPREEAIALLETRSKIAQICQPPNRWQQWQLGWCDRHLKGWGDRIVQTVDLAAERRRRWVNRSEWWWYLEPAGDRWQRWDGLSLFVSRLCLPIAAAFILNISSTLLEPGTDWVGALALAVQTLAASIVGGSIITQAGQDTLKRLAIRWGFGDRAWHELGAFLSLILLVFVIIFQVIGFPMMSDFHNHRGQTAYNKHNIATAEKEFKRSLLFNPDHQEAQYRLGRLYDQLNNHSKAREFYQQVVNSGLNEKSSPEQTLNYLQAANNLGRLWLLKKDSAIATSILRQAEGYLPQSGISPDKPWQKQDLIYAQSAYAIQKNLGWARVQAKLPSDAIAPLQRAIVIATEFEQRAETEGEHKAWQSWMSQRGVAGCRLATALELALKMKLSVVFKDDEAAKAISKQDLKKRAINTWETCQSASVSHDDITPEEEALRDSADHRATMLDQREQL